MKRVLVVILSALMLVSFVACTAPTPAAPANSGGSEASGTNAASGEKFEINIALHTKDGTSEEACAMFKKEVESKTNGNISVKIYENGTLGTEAENITQVSSGELNSALLGSLYPQQVLSEYNASGIPFAFPDVEAVEDYWNGSVGEEMRKVSIDKSNIKLVGLIRRGPRLLTANKKIVHPSELAGLKLRLPENAQWIAVWKSLGTNPTPVNWNEVYTSLQTGVVDAQENPIATYYSAKIQEVQKYTMVTNHINQHFAWVFNNEFFESMPSDYQQIVLDAVNNAVEFAKDDVAAREADYKQKLIDEGHTFVDVDIEEWQAAAKNGILEAMEGLNDAAKNAIKQYMK